MESAFKINRYGGGVKIRWSGCYAASLHGSSTSLERKTIYHACYVVNRMGDAGDSGAALGFSWEFDIPSWEDMYESLLELARRIRKARFKPDIVVGVARGGWPVARVMSDLLENPEVANVKAEFYVGVAETKKEPVITQPVSASVKQKRVLVVDDVADTGKSLALVKEHLEKQGAVDIKIATIYYKPWSALKPDWFERQTERWIVFPWERKETIKRILEKCKKEGVPVEQAKEALVRHGLDRKLAERFIQEIAEEES